MQTDSFYIKTIHKINTLKLKAFVLGLGTLNKEEISYSNCELTKLLNKKISEAPDNTNILLQLDFTHKQYHENAEKIIDLKNKNPEKAVKLLNDLKDNSIYILEQIAKL